MPTNEARRGGGAARMGFILGLTVVAAEAPSPSSAYDRSTCKFFSQLPDDCASAEQRRFDNLRGYRFVEIDLLARDAIKKIPYVSIYNTTGQNGGDDTRDSAPRSYADTLDAKRIAKHYQALVASMSGPRYWALDWLADRVGTVRDFDGLEAAWMGNGQAAETRLAGKAPLEAYRVAPFPRTAIEGFRKGTAIYLLDDPKGNAWVLASYTASGAPNANLDDLDTLGDRLNLPPGWKFRKVTLDRELTLEPKGGFAASTQDDKGDLYHLAGPGQSNFTP
jgi:hypothetical protein